MAENRFKPGSAVIALVVLSTLLPGPSLADGQQIYRCAQADGSVAFQGMPCAEPETGQEVPDESEATDVEPEVTDADERPFVNPFDLPAQPAVEEPEAFETDPLPEELSMDRQLCEETTRRQIDAIDAELAGVDDRARLDELLALTRQLRACKSL